MYMYMHVSYIQMHMYIILYIKVLSISKYTKCVLISGYKEQKQYLGQKNVSRFKEPVPVPSHQDSHH